MCEQIQLEKENINFFSETRCKTALFAECTCEYSSQSIQFHPMVHYALLDWYSCILKFLIVIPLNNWRRCLGHHIVHSTLVAWQDDWIFLIAHRPFMTMLQTTIWTFKLVNTKKNQIIYHCLLFIQNEQLGFQVQITLVCVSKQIIMGRKKIAPQ